MHAGGVASNSLLTRNYGPAALASNQSGPGLLLTGNSAIEEAADGAKESAASAAHEVDATAVEQAADKENGSGQHVGAAVWLTCWAMQLQMIFGGVHISFDSVSGTHLHVQR